MNSYWVTFKNREGGCVEADSHESAKAIAMAVTGAEPVDASIIPYPADPRLNVLNYSKSGPIPSTCYTPLQCIGFIACPKPKACNDRNSKDSTRG